MLSHLDFQQMSFGETPANFPFKGSLFGHGLWHILRSLQIPVAVNSALRPLCEASVTYKALRDGTCPNAIFRTKLYHISKKVLIVPSFSYISFLKLWFFNLTKNILLLLNFKMEKMNLRGQII